MINNKIMQFLGKIIRIKEIELNAIYSEIAQIKSEISNKTLEIENYKLAINREKEVAFNLRMEATEYFANIQKLINDATSMIATYNIKLEERGSEMLLQTKYLDELKSTYKEFLQEKSIEKEKKEELFLSDFLSFYKTK